MEFKNTLLLLKTDFAMRAVASFTLTVLFVALMVSRASATDHAVVPSTMCANNGDGTSWNCAASNGAAGAFRGLPSTLVRGDVYYLADGNYGNHLSLNAADSGTKVIELRKAQSYDFGGMTGWNTATMGSSQAVWSWATAGSMVQFGSDYWTINGNGNGAATEIGCGGVQANPPASMLDGPPNPAGCGIKIDASTCISTANNGCDGGNGEMHGAGTGITWESVEWKGQGLNSNGTNNSETYFWFATSSTNMLVTHSYLHNASTTYITNASGNWNNGTVSYNYFWGLFDGSYNHGEALQDTGTDSGTVIHHNIFRDQITNGDLVFVDPVTGTHSNFAFYDNVDFCSQGNSCRHNDGFIACINSSQTCTGFLIYNNTFGPGITTNTGIVSTNTGSYTVQNNLWYNCVNALVNGTGFTQDHNSFLNTTGSSGPTNVNITSGAPNPFVDWPAGNFNLASDNADWNNRTPLGNPYNVDMNGTTFTTDRGAYQFVASGSPPAITSSAPTAAATAGVTYNFSYTATGSPVPTFSVSAGSLPPGLTLTSAGVLSGIPNAPGSYSGTVTAQNGVNPVATQNFAITVANTYNFWATTQEGLTGANALQTAVVSPDGLANLFKYALGLNPFVTYNPGSTGLPVVAIKNISGTNYLTLAFTGVATDVTYTVQATSDLVTWSNIYSSTAGVAPGTITVQDTQAITTPPPSKRMLRLVVTSP